jgi:dihydrofolate synthase/folylpolyglutamate synthase
VQLSLAGEHQVVNALTAVAALVAIVIDASAINAGLASAEWPGRLQTIERDPEILLDAALNPGGARVLARFLANHRAGRTIRLIYGASRDKAIDEVAGTLFPLAAEVYLTRSQVTRSVRPALLAEITDHHHANVHLTANLGEAIEAARAASGSGDVIVIAGSVFLVGEAIGLLRREPSLSVPG